MFLFCSGHDSISKLGVFPSIGAAESRPMSSSDLSPEAIKLLNRMTGPPLSHPSFTGEPIDLAQIDPLSLGDLWTIAHATNRWENNRPIKSLAAETASSILKLGEKMEPAFRGAAAR